MVQAIGSCATANPNPNPNPVSFAAVGDFNGDCTSDLLWHNSATQQVYEWLMSGATFTGSGSPGTRTSDWVIQGTGDFDGDGKADILWRNTTTGVVEIWLINGTTASSTPSAPSRRTGSFRALAISMATAKPISSGVTALPARSTSGS